MSPQISPRAAAPGASTTSSSADSRACRLIPQACRAIRQRRGVTGELIIRRCARVKTVDKQSHDPIQSGRRVGGRVFGGKFAAPPPQTTRGPPGAACLEEKSLGFSREVVELRGGATSLWPQPLRCKHLGTPAPCADGVPPTFLCSPEGAFRGRTTWCGPRVRLQGAPGFRGQAGPLPEVSFTARELTIHGCTACTWHNHAHPHTYINHHGARPRVCRPQALGAVSVASRLNCGGTQRRAAGIPSLGRFIESSVFLCQLHSPFAVNLNISIFKMCH
jgi:hypothetical protein